MTAFERQSHAELVRHKWSRLIPNAMIRRGIMASIRGIRMLLNEKQQTEHVRERLRQLYEDIHLLAEKGDSDNAKRFLRILAKLRADFRQILE